jgi:superfamily II DNA or RNA helicase
MADGYQASMLNFGSQKLTELRHRMPAAGGLVIAPSIEIAEYMTKLLEQLEGETPVLVHSQMSNADNKIKAFRNTDKRWLVSVAMVSEGVDIPRLRLLVYLSNAMTELAFRQAIGRVVRSAGPADDTRAYVVMPSFDTFEVYARRVEDEMSPSARRESGVVRTKTCPACSQESPLNAPTCSNCSHVFPVPRRQFKSCQSCGALNHVGATACHACGSSFQAEFKLSLDEALRAGAIVRGMDIDEDEVRLAEQMAPNIRSRILKTGDDTLVRILQVLPEESWGRLKAILEAERQT